MFETKKRVLTEAERLSEYYLALQRRLQNLEIKWAIERINRDREEATGEAQE